MDLDELERKLTTLLPVAWASASDPVHDKDGTTDRRRLMNDYDASGGYGVRFENAHQNFNPLYEAQFLIAAARELIADARRYRWLRSVTTRHEAGKVFVYDFFSPIAYGDSVDSAIDAAIAQERKP